MLRWVVGAVRSTLNRIAWSDGAVAVLFWMLCITTLGLFGSGEVCKAALYVLAAVGGLPVVVLMFSLDTEGRKRQGV